MFIKRLIQLCSLAIILSAGILVGCGSSAEEQAVALVDLTTTPASYTPMPSSTSAPIEITPTPIPEPQVVLLRGAKECEREQNIIANSPIQLHYGVWGSVGKAYSEGSWDLLDITLTMDGEEIEGEKQPVAADLIKHCGSDAEDIYWMFYIELFNNKPNCSLNFLEPVGWSGNC